MTVDALRDALDQAGIAVHLAGDKLRVVAPVGALTPALRDELREHKPMLIAFLKRQQIGPHFAPSAACGSRTTCEVTGYCILPGRCQLDAWLARRPMTAQP